LTISIPSNFTLPHAPISLAKSHCYTQLHVNCIITQHIHQTWNQPTRSTQPCIPLGH